ncbi:hypothetical protein ACPPVS_04915 [Cellulomonas sp. McL0617]|uniref:hypothetical protein n=1 Tax=Cellulomonas sp. McL0617 TaxID=3415675 RepID=UPI003CF37844
MPGAAFGLFGDGLQHAARQALDVGLRSVDESLAKVRPEVVEPAESPWLLPATQPRQSLPASPFDAPQRMYVPRPHYDATEILGLVARRRRARNALRRIDAAIDAEVDRARDCRQSWDEIGRYLGISRQGARQRYNERSVHSADAAPAPSTDSSLARPPSSSTSTS